MARNYIDTLFALTLLALHITGGHSRLDFNPVQIRSRSAHSRLKLTSIGDRNNNNDTWSGCRSGFGEAGNTCLKATHSGKKCFYHYECDKAKKEFCPEVLHRCANTRLLNGSKPNNNPTQKDALWRDIAWNYVLEGNVSLIESPLVIEQGQPLSFWTLTSDLLVALNEVLTKAVAHNKTHLRSLLDAFATRSEGLLGDVFRTFVGTKPDKQSVSDFLKALSLLNIPQKVMNDLQVTPFNSSSPLESIEGLSLKTEKILLQYYEREDLMINRLDVLIFLSLLQRNSLIPESFLFRIVDTSPLELSVDDIIEELQRHEEVLRALLQSNLSIPNAIDVISKTATMSKAYPLQKEVFEKDNFGKSCRYGGITTYLLSSILKDALSKGLNAYETRNLFVYNFTTCSGLKNVLLAMNALDYPLRNITMFLQRLTTHDADKEVLISLEGHELRPPARKEITLIRNLISRLLTGDFVSQVDKRARLRALVLQEFLREVLPLSIYEKYEQDNEKLSDFLEDHMEEIDAALGGASEADDFLSSSEINGVVDQLQVKNDTSLQPPKESQPFLGDVEEKSKPQDEKSKKKASLADDTELNSKKSSANLTSHSLRDLNMGRPKLARKGIIGQIVDPRATRPVLVVIGKDGTALRRTHSFGFNLTAVYSLEPSPA